MEQAKTRKDHGGRRLALAFCLGLPAAAPAAASESAITVEPQARLAKAGDETAVRIKGRVAATRAAAGYAVYVSGHLVHRGSQPRFSIDVPLAQLRDWNAPYASHVSVTILPRDGREATAEPVEQEVALPVGALGLRAPGGPITLSAG